MDSFKQLLKKIKDFVITVDPYEEVLQDKDTEIEELKEIIAQLCYRNMSAINEALSYFGSIDAYEDDDTDLEDTKGGCLGGLSDTEFQELLTKTK